MHSKNESQPDEIPSAPAIFVALGSNDKGAFGNSEGLLDAVLQQFPLSGIEVLARSSWWQSAAWPDPTDPSFINGVVQVRTALSPDDLMSTLMELEQAFGRRRQGRNAPRTLDLDLIAYGDRVGETGEGLVLPHPRAAERRFVMGPLAEISPDWIHPQLGQTAVELAQEAKVGQDARIQMD